MKAKIILTAIAIVALPVLARFGLDGYRSYQEALRVQDAAPAFDPLAKLKPVILSQPFGERYCRYILDFPQQSLLADDNIGILESLNLLPQQNELEVSVRSERVTDAAIATIASLRSIDALDVTATAISDNGLAQLKAGMPQTVVVLRRQGEPKHN